MIKEAIEKILQIAPPTTFDIKGHTYSSQNLTLIKPVIDQPVPVRLYSLDGIVKMIRREHGEFPSPLFIHVKSHCEVEVFSTYSDDHFTRLDLCKAEATGLPGVPNNYIDYDDAMIKLRSIFQQNEGTAYLLGLLGSITDKNSVTSNDNGITQEVKVTTGVALAFREQIKPRVSLRPFRTFLEVDQPESEFLVRVKEGGQIGFYEADGGMWKLTARRTIHEYLSQQLADMVADGTVEIMI